MKKIYIDGFISEGFFDSNKMDEFEEYCKGLLEAMDFLGSAAFECGDPIDFNQTNETEDES